MSMIEARLPLGGYQLAPEPAETVSSAPSVARAPMPHTYTLTPIVPPNSISGRALVAVIAIMSFLAALTLGAVVLVRGAAAEWQSQVAREMTIQIRPAEGRDIDAEVGRAVDLVRTTPGIAEAKAFTKEESARLLEPWLGTGLSLDELPIPRMIVVTIAPGGAPDLDRLRKTLAERVTGASLDDHRGWVERMRAMTRAAVAVGIGVLGLVLAATVLLVAFATRGAMAANRAIVEVLHFVGAKNRYIAGQFQRHFLWLGLKGAGVGGGAAIALFLAAGMLAGRTQGTASEDHVQALLGSLALGPQGYAGIVGVIVLVAAVTAITSRYTVHRTLSALE
jgi:cell division transport system permease protein